MIIYVFNEFLTLLAIHIFIFTKHRFKYINQLKLDKTANVLLDDNTIADLDLGFLFLLVIVGERYSYFFRTVMKDFD